jgi:ABC-type nickel/cobalt efflux system permease component RcnA
VLNDTSPVEVVSYALIALIGLWMLFQAATGRGHNHHHHGPHSHGEGEEEHARHHDHDHDHDHSHDHGASAGAGLPRRASTREMIWLAVTAGLVPCASAIIVMLFALAQNAFAIGVEAALAMSLGMALTVSAIGLASIFARRLLERAVAGSTRGAVALERGLQFGGALTLVVFASLFCLGAWVRL